MAEPGASLEDFHMRLMRAFHAQRTYLRPKVDELGLGPGQPKLLVYLAVHGPSSQRELAAFFECDPGAVSRMLDSLERAAFADLLGRARANLWRAIDERGER